jgi:drug/metabolite transporter (DMT)-like permease
MAAILSTVEPPTTVVLAFAAFGESPTVVQLTGGALVLGAVLVLQHRPAPTAAV